MKLTEFPHLVKEWHPTKNGDLRPEDVTHASKKLVWWKCIQGHTFQSAIRNRTRQKANGCPECPKHYPKPDNNLLITNPQIAKEWHPTKNNGLLPEQVRPNSTNSAWWLCPVGHSYETKISYRTRWKESKCPFCLGRRVGEDNNLLVKNPDVAEEWDYEKNNPLRPEEFVPGTKTKVWWLCPKGHSYQASIGNRTKTNPTGCPKCTNQTSQPEVRILSELESIFDDVRLHYKLENTEIDIYLPEIKFGIEYDGKYWHKGLDDVDLKKNEFLSDNGIKLIRVRQKPLSKLTPEDILVGYQVNKTNINQILDRIYPSVSNEIQHRIKEYQNNDRFINEEKFKEYRSYFPAPIIEKSLLKTHPELAKEWDYEKNNPLKPEDITYGSKKLVWWLCEKGHSYESRPNSRTARKDGCPYCSGRRSLTPDLFES